MLRNLSKLHYVSSSRPEVGRPFTIFLVQHHSPMFLCKLAYDNVYKANLFNKHFASISSVPDVVLSKPFSPFNYCTSLPCVNHPLPSNRWLSIVFQQV